MMTAVVSLLVLAALWLLSLRGRRNHPGMEAFRGTNYAHRGLHGNGVPENSMMAFRLAFERGYGLELDLHLMKDGNLAVIHDASLQRTAGKDVRIEDLTAEERKDYPLEGTEEIIPLFSQVLELYQGKIPLIIELKPERGNSAALTAAACAAMEGYSGSWCMESFDPRCILWLKKNRPEIIRGQLAYNYFSKKGKLPWILKVVLSFNLLNFLTRPDFVAYRFCDRKMPGVEICRKLWGLQGVSWTLKTMEEYETATKEGWIPIFEDFTP